MKSLGFLIQIVYWVTIALAAVYLAWRYRREIPNALRGWLAGLRSLWSRLFGRKTGDAFQGQANPIAVMPRSRPSSDFADPFVTGRAEKCSVDELVRYSFEAFEAWSNDHGCARSPDQTVHEFARQLGRRIAALAPDALRLADLVSWSAYSQEAVPRSSLPQLKQLWRRMRDLE
jgi:hypothetical protein